ncbi:MAG TPA: glycosyltransferase family 4 protein [Baekduia sp.]|nr:glycosyltransferase family 4 protein [Baekduia sp.]
MKVCFLLNDLALSGGTGVVVEHAHQLATQHDMEVTLVVCGSQDGAWDYRRLAGVRVIDLAEARRDRFDVAVATWWRTAYDLFDVPAERHAYFVQSLEERFYERFATERLTAALTHTLPVAFITEARWIRDLLVAFAPGAQVHYVRNGIDKEVFPVVHEVSRSAEGRLRILLEGHPEVWFKGIDESVEVLRQLTEPFQATLVTGATGYQSPEVVHRRVGPLTQRELAKEYAEHDVVLKMSRVEGMYGPPLEAFHRGATVVTTPVTGHDEYVEHGWNGLVADWDDLRGTARFLDLLARDRVLLHRLRRNAVDTARAWPSWDQAGDVMAGALRAIVERPMADPRQGAARMLGDILAGTVEQGLERRQLIVEIHERRREVDHLQGELAKVKGQIDDYHAQLLAKGDELSAVVHSPRWAYGGAVQRLLGGRMGRAMGRLLEHPVARRSLRRALLRLTSG